MSTLAALLLLLLAAGTLGDPAQASSPTAPSPADSLALVRLEAALRAAPRDLRAAEAYRQKARTTGQLGRAAAVLEELAAAHPGAVPPRLELALALVDRLAGPAAGVGERAILANRAVNHLNRILEADPADWTARYFRGLTHLLFPRVARHSPIALEDFERLVAVQKDMEPKPYFARAYLGLGDACAASVRPIPAREAWMAGLERFPGHPELERRTALGVKEIDGFIVDTYRLDRPFDTDLSFLWSK